MGRSMAGQTNRADVLPKPTRRVQVAICRPDVLALPPLGILEEVKARVHFQVDQYALCFETAEVFHDFFKR